MASAAWRHFDHEADMGVSATGGTLAEAFEQAAAGMMAIVTDETIHAQDRVDVECAAPDPELLLIDWLNALIFEMATRRMLFGSFSVTVDPSDGEYRLHGTAWGEPVQRARHHPAVELKGATYTALEVHHDANDQWVAQCVVDV